MLLTSTESIKKKAGKAGEELQVRQNTHWGYNSILSATNDCTSRCEQESSMYQKKGILSKLEDIDVHSHTRTHIQTTWAFHRTCICFMMLLRSVPGIWKVRGLW